MDLAALLRNTATAFPAVAFLESWFPDPRLPDGRRNTDGREIGTGTLITPRLILTAGHMLYDAFQGGQTQVVRATLGNPPVSVVSAQVDFPMEWRQPRSDLDSSVVSPVDIGIIILANPIDSRAAEAMPVSTTSDADLTGIRLNVVGYPANPVEVDPQPGPLGTLYGTQFHVVRGNDIPDGGTRFEEFRLFYPVRTVGGISGGPVYDRDSRGTRTLRGIHTSFVQWSDGSFLGSALRIDDEIKANLIDFWIQQHS